MILEIMCKYENNTSLNYSIKLLTTWSYFVDAVSCNHFRILADIVCHILGFKHLRI
jgi:hypothetical protein